MITVLSGFLLRLNVFSLLPLFITIITADMIGDLGWYGIGYKWGESFVNRFGKFFGITLDSVEVVKKKFHQHKNKVLFLSKITMGFGFALATIITAGLTKIPLKNFLILNTLGQLIWTSFLLSLGYFLGTFYLAIDKGFQTISLVAFAIFTILLISRFSNYLRQYASK